MSELTYKKRLSLLEQSIYLDSKYFHAMSVEKAQDYLNCIHTLLTSNDHIILEASLSNMQLITKNVEIDEEEKGYKLQVAKKMIGKKLSDSDIHEILGMSYFEIGELKKKTGCVD
ncbi:hypothetical protein [Niallia sp.]|uniref:hypothetical protein n=1 Tax=Niallia sp. TaxID=2837523 RepID=UPI00289F6778|nr:hypothetical protein [Niallia sp.]